MTPLEAMARAIDPGASWHLRIAEDSHATNDLMIKARREQSLMIARAALTALRDCGVTEGMAVAYCRADGMALYPPISEDDDPDTRTFVEQRAWATAEFRAMLDAALQEG